MSSRSTTDKKIGSWIKYTAWGAIVVTIILLIVYIWSFPIKWLDDNFIAHTDAIGTFGDFLGGIFGTIFAFFGTYLMYLTLRAQRLLTERTNRIQRDLTVKTIEAQEELARKTNEFQTALEHQNVQAQKELAIASEKEAKLQRFNALFFELLNLLSQQRSQLNQSISEAGYEGLNYFDVKMAELTDSFTPSYDYGRSVKKAANHYRNFYLRNASDIAPFFRTLYRIMDLIYESKIEKEEKRQFAKIIRAQLRESELFMFRYNAMIEYGENFINYINLYKLLKHLPIMALMEMKRFKEIVNQSGVQLSLRI